MACLPASKKNFIVMTMKRHKSHRQENSQRVCAYPGCMEPGEYPAPLSPKELHKKQYFCLRHIREFNKNWNFFKDMSEVEAEHYRLNSITGHRPTWKMGVEVNEEEVIHKVFEMFSDSKAHVHDTPYVTKHLPIHIKDALSVLGLSNNANYEMVKKRYRDLVKKFHPDVCGKKGEERFKHISQAYQLLKQYGWDDK